MNNPFLIGEKIYLRPIELADASFICQGENHPQVRETLFLALPLGSSRSEEKIRHYLSAHDSIVFIIADKSTDKSVGQTALFRVDYISRAAVFYLAILHPDYWAKGYGGEATWLMVDYAFMTLNLNRIQLHVFAENTAAIKIYQRVGFIKEGVLRQAMYHHGVYCDFWVMGILKQDWLKSNGNVASNHSAIF